MLALAGCAVSRTPEVAGESAATAAPRELAAVPFFPQEIHECGPAALATVLVASGADLTPETLVPEVYLPQRRGSLQAEMIAASRRHERLPYVIEPRLEVLVAEVAAGRPVLVLQNLGLPLLPRWHYAVVIGASPQRIMLRSGRRERLGMSTRAFLRTWKRADSWGLVVLRAGELPASVELARWLRSNAALEEIGRYAMARENYAVATQRWPDEELAWLALGNVEYRLGNGSDAELAWRHALALAPGDAVVHNNLAQLLLERGCGTAAREHIEAARRTVVRALREQVEATARRIDAAPGGRCEPKKKAPHRGASRVDESTRVARCQLRPGAGNNRVRETNLPRAHRHVASTSNNSVRLERRSQRLRRKSLRPACRFTPLVPGSCGNSQPPEPVLVSSA